MSNIAWEEDGSALCINGAWYNIDPIHEGFEPNIEAAINTVRAQGIRKVVAHLKETHGGDRFSSSAYLTYADNLCKGINDE